MKQLNEELTYNITQVAEITGLSKQVIRKWEERYDLIRPSRLDNGYRIYHHHQVRTLLDMIALIDQGHTVKQAAEELKKQDRVQSIPFTTSNADINEYVQTLLEHGEHCRECDMITLLQHTFHVYGLASFLETIIHPFFIEIDERSASGQWHEGQVALTRLVVRDYLVQIRRNFHCTEEAPLILGACLPNEKDEIPILIFMLQCMLLGYRTAFIGPSPTFEVIQSTIQQLKPAKVIFSSATSQSKEAQVELINELDAFAKETMPIECYLIGSGFTLTKDHTSPHYLHLTQSMEEILE